MWLAMLMGLLAGSWMDSVTAQAIPARTIRVEEMSEANNLAGLSWEDSSVNLAEPLRELVEGMRREQRKLMHTSGGIRITYSVAVSQAAHGGPIAFDSAIGETRILWPVLYNRFGAVMRAGRANATDTVRTASHDFQAGCGVALDSDREATISPYRSAWTCHYLYALRPLYWPWTDQHFVPDQRLAGDYWLPDALVNDSPPYEHTGDETVAGQVCQVWRRGNVDALWISPNAAFLVLRREMRSSDLGLLVEKLQVDQLREWAPGIWLPATFKQSVFSRQSGELSYANLVTVSHVDVGTLREQDVVVDIPESVLQVQDQIRNVLIRNPRGDEPIQQALGEAAESLSYPSTSRSPQVRNWLAGIAVLLGVLLALILFRRAR